jgi:hypothetical protein
MACTTRSGVQWSPWELNGVASVVPDLFQSKISLAPHLALADLHTEALDSSMGEGDAWEDEPHILSRPPTPSSRPPSPLTPLSRSPTPPLRTDDGSVRSPAFLLRLPRASNDAKAPVRRLVGNAPAWPLPRPPRLVHHQRHATPKPTTYTTPRPLPLYLPRSPATGQVPTRARRNEHRSTTFGVSKPCSRRTMT